MAPKSNTKQQRQVAAIVGTFGLKSSIGKTTVIRGLIDLCDEIGRGWNGISVDRSERLPSRYPGRIAQITLPTDGEGRRDPYATTRAFGPLDDAVDRTILDRSTLLIDVGSGEYPRATLDHIARSRLHALLARNGVIFTALLVTTTDPMVMADLPRLAEAAAVALPAARIVLVLNERNGPFRFADGSEAMKVWKTGVQPLLQRFRRVTIPAMPTGCWDRFEDQGLRFSEVAQLDPDTCEADERKLIAWTQQSRSLAVVQQGDVSDWLHATWSALAPIIVETPSTEAGHE